MLIRSISKSWTFAKGESIIPAFCAYLIDKQSITKKKNIPRWIELLTPLFCGVYTLDNLDYVLRDSYMCGVAIGPVDINIDQAWKTRLNRFFGDKNV